MAAPTPEKQIVDFDSIRLKVGDSLHMQPVGIADAPHYIVRYMGGLEGASLITTLPVIDNEGLWMRYNGEYIFRVLSGSHIYAFVSRLLKARAHPYPYAHFACPDKVEARRVRRSPRIKLRLDIETEKADGGKLSATLLDLSLHGALLEADSPLGEAGDTLRITLPSFVTEINRQLTIRADIRNVIDGDQPKYGLEFHRLSDEDVMQLHFFIDFQIAEGDSA